MSPESIGLLDALRIWSASAWNWASLALLLLSIILLARHADPEAGLVSLILAWQVAFLGASLDITYYGAWVAAHAGNVTIPWFLSQLRARSAIPCALPMAVTAVLLLIPRKTSLFAAAWRRRWQVVVLAATAATLLLVASFMSYILTGSLLS